MAYGSLKTFIFIESLTECRSPIQYSNSNSFDTFRDEIGRLLPPKSKSRSRSAIAISSKDRRTIAIAKLNDRDIKNVIAIYLAFFQQSTFCRSNISQMPELKEWKFRKKSLPMKVFWDWLKRSMIFEIGVYTIYRPLCMV